MSIVLHYCEDDQCDITFKDKYRFSPSIPMEELQQLDYLFCVDSMKNSRCMASNKRDLCITKKYREKFDFKKNYSYSDIDSKLKGIELIAICRKIDEHGNKFTINNNGEHVDNDYMMIKGFYEKMHIRYYGYDGINIILNIGDSSKEFTCDRVFIQKTD